MKKLNKVEVYININYYLNLISNSCGVIDMVNGINISSFNDIRRYIKNTYDIMIDYETEGNNDFDLSPLGHLSSYQFHDHVVSSTTNVISKYDIDKVTIQTDNEYIPINEWVTKSDTDNDRWRKCIIIINGKGGCGKDTLIEGFTKFCNKIDMGFLYSYSIIQPIKEKVNALSDLYHLDHSKKDNKFRKFLSDMKLAFDEFDDSNYKYIEDATDKFINRSTGNDKCDFMFVTMRESKDINRFYKAYNHISDHGVGLIRLLVIDQEIGDKEYGNVADDNVEDCEYDFVYNNKRTDDLSLAESNFNSFMFENIIKPHNMIG